MLCLACSATPPEYRHQGVAKRIDYCKLAFNWPNFRICGQLLAAKKGDLSPICEGQRCTADDPVSLQLEAPILIDPLTDQASLISFEADEDGCRAISLAGNDELDRIRAERTIEILGLNRRDQLNRKRKNKWDQCLRHTQDYRSAQTTDRVRSLSCGFIRPCSRSAFLCALSR
jgi:hypothetical protein